MSGQAKGWCPGALRPMESGDGFVVRLRLSCGEAPLALARSIADWAEAFGSGDLDLSARGNLQLRGVGAADLSVLHARLAEAGLLDLSPEAEAVHNVLVSPFAGLDPDAALDVRAFAQAWERELASQRDLWRLPGKFGASFDAGGFPLGQETDLAFVALGRDTFFVRLGGAGALGPFRSAALVDVAGRLTRAFLALPDPPRRMREAIAVHGLCVFAQAARLSPVEAPAAPARPRVDWLGAHALGRRAFAGLALPFGRIEAAALRLLADLAAEAGASALRLTPWRALIVPTPTLAAAQRLAGAASAIGLIVDPLDPLLSVAACPGAPACSSGLGETRALARRLAARLGARAGIALHVSGCAKGCAHPAAAPLTLVATGDGYDFIRQGRADAAVRQRGLDETALARACQEFAR